MLVELQRGGELPSDCVWKISVMAAPSTRQASEVLERLGAKAVNVPFDVSLVELSELRQSSDTILDLYVESPDGMEWDRQR